jgi:predicted dehydrogenase
MHASTIRAGVFGLRRGLNLALNAQAAGFDVVAVCDQDEERLDEAKSRLQARTFSDFETFVEQDLDAVMLANYFDEHAPFAIAALGSGKHVLSETAACRNIAEAVLLIDAVERSGRVYMFGETFPFLTHAREMERLYRAGELGSFVYAESEYVHPMDLSFASSHVYAPGARHWRRRITWPAYSTHSIAPVMRITDTLPVRVSAAIIPADSSEKSLAAARRGAGVGAALLVHMSNGGVMRSLQGVFPGGEFSWIRIHGTGGLVENLRHGDKRRVRFRKEAWLARSGVTQEHVYLPDATPQLTDSLLDYGVADFPDYPSTDSLLCREFADAIRTGELPYFDVYRGVAATLAGLCAHRSALDGWTPVEVPDLRSPMERERCKSDDWSWYIAE